jgi:hypothetical protein
MKNKGACADRKVSPDSSRKVFTRKPKLGSTPTSGVAGRASRPAFLRCTVGGIFGTSDVLVVFREGAENGTRGACAPHFNLGFRVLFACFDGWSVWDLASGVKPVAALATFENKRIQFHPQKS